MPSLRTICPHCRQRIVVSPEQVRTKQHCPRCEKEVSVDLGSVFDVTKFVEFSCEACGEPMRGRKTAVGKSLACGKCGKANQIPDPNAPSVSAASNGNGNGANAAGSWSSWFAMPSLDYFTGKAATATPSLDADPNDFAKFIEHETAKKEGRDAEPIATTSPSTWWDYVPDPLGIGETIQAVKDRVEILDAKNEAEKRLEEEYRRTFLGRLHTLAGSVAHGVFFCVLLVACIVASFFMPPLGIGGTLVLVTIGAVLARR